MNPPLKFLGQLMLAMLMLAAAAANADDCPGCQNGAGGQLAASGAGGTAMARGRVLSEKQAASANDNICKLLGDYTADGWKAASENFAEKCQSYDDSGITSCPYVNTASPKYIIPVSIASALEITNPAELDRVLPAAVAQLMTMPCDPNRTAPQEQNHGDNFVKRKIGLSRQQPLISQFLGPLCLRQPDYKACIDMLMSAAEPIGNGTQETLADYVKKLRDGEVPHALEPSTASQIYDSITRIAAGEQMARGRVLNDRQAEIANLKICLKTKSYGIGIKVKKRGFRACKEPNRVNYCSSFPEVLEPKDFISLYISEELEITNHAELDQVLPAALAQLMTMPCDKDRTAAYQQNYGDNFIKRAIKNRRVYEIVTDFFVPLCKRQADYYGCIETLAYAAEPIPDGSEENIIDFARKLNEWRLKFRHITLTQSDVDLIFGRVVGLEFELNSARAKEKSEAP